MVVYFYTENPVLSDARGRLVKVLYLTRNEMKSWNEKREVTSHTLISRTRKWKISLSNFENTKVVLFKKHASGKTYYSLLGLLKLLLMLYCYQLQYGKGSLSPHEFLQFSSNLSSSHSTYKVHPWFNAGNKSTFTDLSSFHYRIDNLNITYLFLVCSCSIKFQFSQLDKRIPPLRFVHLFNSNVFRHVEPI